jgi:oxygen-independent coproporphyrinogen-3 oxidase
MEGLVLQRVSREFGLEKRNQLEQNAAKYIALDQIKKENNKLLLTRKGKLFADGIAGELFFVG